MRLPFTIAAGNLADAQRTLNEAVVLFGRLKLTADLDRLWDTLAPFVVNRDEAVPYPGVRELLCEIIGAGRTRVVIVTGRAVVDLLTLLALDPMPEVWGSHGWEHRLPDATYRPPVFPPQTAAALQQAITAAEQAGLGDRLERKPASVACHWRGLSTDAAEHVRVQIERVWSHVGADGPMKLRAFDGGYELSVVGRTKGDAVRDILRSEHAPPAAFLGDDLTDEDAFVALGESGLRVLVRPEHRHTVADLWLVPPEELLEFLRHWI